MGQFIRGVFYQQWRPQQGWGGVEIQFRWRWEIKAGEYGGDLEDKSRMDFISFIFTGYHTDDTREMVVISSTFVNKVEGLFDVSLTSSHKPQLPLFVWQVCVK